METKQRKGNDEGQDEYGILNVGKEDKRMGAGRKKRGGGKNTRSASKRVGGVMCIIKGETQTKEKCAIRV